MAQQCAATVYDRVPAWPCPAGSLDRPRKCRREATKGTRYCTQHQRTHVDLSLDNYMSRGGR